MTCLVTLFDRKLQIFKNSPKWTIIGIFNLLLSIQNANVVRFSSNGVWYFFCNFQTLCTYVYLNMKLDLWFYFVLILIYFRLLEIPHRKLSGTRASFPSKRALEWLLSTPTRNFEYHTSVNQTWMNTHVWPETGWKMQLDSQPDSF